MPDSISVEKRRKQIWRRAIGGLCLKHYLHTWEHILQNCQPQSSKFRGKNTFCSIHYWVQAHTAVAQDFSLCQLNLWDSHSVVSDSLQPHGLQHTRLPRPSPAPRACSNSFPLNWWCHPTISSSVVPFFSRLQSFPASRSFLMSRFFTSGGQSIGVAVSVSVLPMNIEDWFSLELTGWISLQSKGLSRVFSNTTVQKHQFFGTQLSL